jgi:serine/threonine-protein phosphatase 2A regulatory subunit A
MIMDVHSRPTAAPSTLPLPSLPLARSLVNISLEKVATMSAYDLFCAQLFAGTSLEANLDAMVRVQVVAATMGPAAATSTLLPFLSSIIMNPDASDELLLVVGQQLFRVAQFCGRDHYADFLPLLERLATTEETVVRDQAAAVMRELCHDLGFSNNTKDTAPYMGVAKRLAGADWFTAKMSACGVFSAVLHVVNRNAPADVTQHVAELLAMYKELCEDETPMVRRAAAKGLGYVILEAGWNNREFCAAVLPPLIHDEQDSVRRLAVAALAHVGGAYAAHPEWTCQHWLPLLKDGSTDMSWYVFVCIYVCIGCFI